MTWDAGCFLELTTNCPHPHNLHQVSFFSYMMHWTPNLQRISEKVQAIYLRCIEAGHDVDAGVSSSECHFGLSKDCWERSSNVLQTQRNSNPKISVSLGKIPLWKIAIRLPSKGSSNASSIAQTMSRTWCSSWCVQIPGSSPQESLERLPSLSQTQRAHTITGVPPATIPGLWIPPCTP